jgi:N-acetylglutamate synthase-like GNAT family acetyltransferase
VEYQARQRGIRRLFLLSTRTGQWFEERGFQETGVDQLPQRKQELYNFERRSKIFVKNIGTHLVSDTSLQSTNQQRNERHAMGSHQHK